MHKYLKISTMTAFPCLHPVSKFFFINERPGDHGLWSPHALSRRYIYPSLEHYCFHHIWIPDTNSVHIGQSVSWYPHKLIMPNCHCHWHNYSNQNISNCSIDTNQQKSSTTTICYHHTQGTFPNQFHLLKCLFCTKSTTTPPRLNFQGYSLQNLLLHLQGCLHPLH